MTPLDESLLRRMPKVLLHEHLDGGLRPQTVIDLAREENYAGLPTADAPELAEWFHRGANRGNLPLYLEGFQHTIAAMQTRRAIERVAFEFIEDMQRDGVVYAEVRFAPCFHAERGLTPEAVVQAALDGLARGRTAYGVEWGLIICGMRDRTDSLEWAELAIDFRHRGVVGFDLAGEEAGYPPKKHVEAFHAIQRANFYSTRHAGEAFGVASIWQALQLCGAHRLGHATRLTDDMTILDGEIVQLGTLAQYILDRRIPLELCLSSNVHTGAVDKIENHPFPMYFRRGFRVTLNTDDRLMSDTSMTKEFQIAAEVFGLNFADLEKLTINSMKSAFIHHDERNRLIYKVIKPGFAALRGGAPTSGPSLP